jgi:hypothetical protein
LIEGQDTPRGQSNQLTVVRGEKNGRAIGVHFVEQGHNFLRQDVVKVTCRLIGQDKRRFIDQGSGQRYTLLLTA